MDQEHGITPFRHDPHVYRPTNIPLSASQALLQPEATPMCDDALAMDQRKNSITDHEYTKALVRYAASAIHQRETHNLPGAENAGVQEEDIQTSSSTIVQSQSDLTRVNPSPLDTGCTPLPAIGVMDHIDSPNNHSSTTPVVAPHVYALCPKGEAAALFEPLPSHQLENMARKISTAASPATGAREEGNAGDNSRGAHRYSPYASRRDLSSTIDRTDASAYFPPHSGTLEMGIEPLKRIIFTSPVVPKPVAPAPRSSNNFDYNQPGHKHILVPVSDVTSPNKQYWEWRLRTSVIITQPSFRKEKHCTNRSTVCGIPLERVQVRSIK